MISRLREFFENLSDAKFALESGMRFRLVLANLIMRDELRQAVAFARIDAQTALKFFDIDPELARRKIKQAYDGLDSLFNGN